MFIYLCMYNNVFYIYIYIYIYIYDIHKYILSYLYIYLLWVTQFNLVYFPTERSFKGFLLNYKSGALYVGPCFFPGTCSAWVPPVAGQLVPLVLARWFPERLNVRLKFQGSLSSN